MKISIDFDNFKGFIDVDENNYTVIREISYISDGKRGRRKEEDKPKTGENKTREDVIGHCSTLDRAINIIIRNIMGNKTETVTLKGYMDEWKTLTNELTKTLTPFEYAAK